MDKDTCNGNRRTSGVSSTDVGQVSLRRATRADTAAIELWLREPGGKQLGWNEDPEMRLSFYIKDASIRHGYIIKMDHKDVGFIMVEHPDYSVDKVLQIDFMLVRKSERRRGVGARAISCLLRLDEWRDAVQVQTGIRETNAGSKRFFTRFGFKAVPKEDYGFTYVYDVPNRAE